MAEKSLPDLMQVGISAVKVTIDPDEFAAWCRKYLRKNNGRARAAYVTDWLKRTGGGKAGSTR